MRNTLAFVLAALAGCGGASAGGPQGTTGATGGGTSTKTSGPSDESWEAPTQDIQGIVFEPEGLGSPGMPLVDAKRKTTLEKQRQVFASAKDPVQKEAQAAILATMLYRESKNAEGDAKTKLLTEARQALRDAAQLSGDKVDEITLRLLGSYELLLGDYAAAEAAWGGLVTKAPTDKDVATNRAWWAYSLLMQAKNQEALAAVKDLPLSEKQPEVAYTMAWAKWRTGDGAGAWQAILTAAKGWGTMGSPDAIERDLLLFAGRTGTSFADASKALPGVWSKGQEYELFARLGLEGYRFAGRWSDGVAAIDKAIAIGGDKVPPNDLPVLRYTQADYTARLDDPDTTVKFAKQALEALPKCGQKCSDKDKEAIVESLSNMATMLHSLYASANDIRYYQPAHDLYEATTPLITMNDQRRDQAKKYAAQLEQTLKTMKAGTGKHDKQAIGTLLGLHNQEIQACYETGLAANPKIGGALSATFEVDQNGVVQGVTTEPKAGLADMSAVAGCVATHVKQWKLPKRGSPGTTRIKVSYTLAPKK